MNWRRGRRPEVKLSCRNPQRNSVEIRIHKMQYASFDRAGKQGDILRI